MTFSSIVTPVCYVDSSIEGLRPLHDSYVKARPAEFWLESEANVRRLWIAFSFVQSLEIKWSLIYEMKQNMTITNFQCLISAKGKSMDKNELLLR